MPACDLILPPVYRPGLAESSMHFRQPHYVYRLEVWMKVDPSVIELSVYNILV